MARHIRNVCIHIEQELENMSGAEYDESIRIMEQTIHNSDKKRKSRESYDKIFQKLEKCSVDYAKIDMYHNQKFERSIGMLWKQPTPARRLLERLHISVLMFVCSNMIANELENFAAFKNPLITADVLNEKYRQLPIPEAVWKKAKNRLELSQVVRLDAQAREQHEQLMLTLPPICMPSRKKPPSPRMKRDSSPADVGSRPPFKRVKMCLPSSLTNKDDEYVAPLQDGYAQYTPLSKVTAVEFMLAYNKWPEVVYLVSPKDFRVLPSLQLNSAMYADLIECAKTIARRDEGNDAAVQSLEGQKYAAVRC